MNSLQESNKALVQAAFERWRDGTGSPFDLLNDDAEWTIMGSSPLSRTYRGKQDFMESVFGPFSARLSTPVKPTAIRGLYADCDTVIVFFDGAATAKDGKPYRNTYSWFFTMKDGRVTSAVAFLDMSVVDDLFARVSPT